ncbi:CRISPR-associated protein Csx20 [Rapidithrix thailandica]|uniref:CRISPR-associated protein Csx20 n=1 Tax=Rapidithrix thailandica TaxID=413964 RepID=A0AAW9S004_9BACT
MKLYLLFSHSLTPEQMADARRSLGVEEFVSLPEDLQQRFSNIPPDIDDLNEYLTPVYDWIGEHANELDYFLVQGDFGATYKIVDFIKSFNYGIPVYATTARQSVDETQPDGSVVTQRIFKHQCFREY